MDNRKNCTNPQCFCDGSCLGLIKSDMNYTSVTKDNESNLTAEVIIEGIRKLVSEYEIKNVSYNEGLFQGAILMHEFSSQQNSAQENQKLIEKNLFDKDLIDEQQDEIKIQRDLNQAQLKRIEELEKERIEDEMIFVLKDAEIVKLKETLEHLRSDDNQWDFIDDNHRKIIDEALNPNK